MVLLLVLCFIILYWCAHTSHSLPICPKPAFWMLREYLCDFHTENCFGMKEITFLYQLVFHSHLYRLTQRSIHTVSSSYLISIVEAAEYATCCLLFVNLLDEVVSLYSSKISSRSCYSFLPLPALIWVVTSDCECIFFPSEGAAA